jgi:hypothetical protein
VEFLEGRVPAEHSRIINLGCCWPVIDDLTGRVVLLLGILIIGVQAAVLNIWEQYEVNVVVAACYRSVVHVSHLEAV